MFLLRAAFWLSVVILLLPGDPKTGAEAPRVGAVEALVAARATIADMSAFCERNPDVCVTGSAAFEVIAAKVRYGARSIFEYFSSPKEEDDAPEGTLSEGDRAQSWRSPKGDKSA